jgi:hypothetical protein
MNVSKMTYGSIISKCIEKFDDNICLQSWDEVGYSSLVGDGEVDKTDMSQYDALDMHSLRIALTMQETVRQCAAFSPVTST